MSLFPGQRWNCNNAGKCGKGLGPQEEFYGCSDVAIGGSSQSTPSSQTLHSGHVQSAHIDNIFGTSNLYTGTLWNRVDPVHQKLQNSKPIPFTLLWHITDRMESATGEINVRGLTTPQHDGISHIWKVKDGDGIPRSVSLQNYIHWHDHFTSRLPYDGTHPDLLRKQLSVTSLPSSVLGEGNPRATPKPDFKLDTAVLACRSVKNYAGDEGMTSWCRDNCPFGFCPRDMCDCSGGNTNINHKIDS